MNSSVRTIPKLTILLLVFLATGISTAFPATASQIVLPEISGYVRELPLSEAERLDAIRYLQSRLVQPVPDTSDLNTPQINPGRYFVRGVRVLQPQSGNEGVFAYLVTYQTGIPENLAYVLDDFTTVEGYYLILLSRSGDDYTLIDELSLTPRELAFRLDIDVIPPPPTLTSDPAALDFSDAVFDATDPLLVEWRDNLVELIKPRMEFRDLTRDGLLDCIVDIEGFEFQPTSYYIVLASASYGFMEGFRSWGFNTDFWEIDHDGLPVIKAQNYSLDTTGEYLPSWRDYYIWNGNRFTLANLNFADEYSDLIASLETLAADRISEETAGGRFESMTRYLVNLHRFRDGEGLPAQYLFNLARIAEYRNDIPAAQNWWRALLDYLNAEYDSQEISSLDDLDLSIWGIKRDYDAWRDELYSSAEAALSED